MIRPIGLSAAQLNERRHAAGSGARQAGGQREHNLPFMIGA